LAFASVTSSRNETTSDRVLLSSFFLNLSSAPVYRALIDNTNISLRNILRGVLKDEKRRKLRENKETRPTGGEKVPSGKLQLSVPNLVYRQNPYRSDDAPCLVTTSTPPPSPLT
jgi:hypothetical protein